MHFAAKAAPTEASSTVVGADLAAKNRRSEVSRILTEIFMFINTIEGGSCIGFPDVCMTPAPGGAAPVPYANTAECCLAESGSFSSKVFVNGMNALHLNTTISQSDGNEAGSGGGVASGAFRGSACFLAGSNAILIEGAPAVSLGNATGQNGNTPNCTGSCTVPGQEKVMLRR